MLKWFRARAGGWALVVLWSFTTLGTLSTTAHGLVCGDELSSIVIAGHGPDAHHAVGAAKTREGPTHCVLCHWIQSFRAAGVRASRIVVVLKAVATPTVGPVRPTRAAARLELPPRAPPA